MKVTRETENCIMSQEYLFCYRVQSWVLRNKMKFKLSADIKFLCAANGHTRAHDIESKIRQELWMLDVRFSCQCL
jgi:hypothetical protein